MWMSQAQVGTRHGTAFFGALAAFFTVLNSLATPLLSVWCQSGLGQHHAACLYSGLIQLRVVGPY